MSIMDMGRWRISGLTRADGVAADPIIGTIGYEDAFVHCVAAPGGGTGDGAGVRTTGSRRH
jgi:hypothetical protein